MPSEIRPKARTARIVVRELGSEIVIYDLDTHDATCLNAAAVRVWRLCDGKRTIKDIAAKLENEACGSRTEDLVLKALDNFIQANLLEEVTKLEASDGENRRDVLRGIVASATAIPLATTISVPAMAQITSCLGRRERCRRFTGPECCPGLECRRRRCRPEQ